MKNLILSSVRSKLILLGVLAFLPVVLLNVFTSWYQRRFGSCGSQVEDSENSRLCDSARRGDYPGNPPDPCDTGGSADPPRGWKTRERISRPFPEEQSRICEYRAHSARRSGDCRRATLQEVFELVRPVVFPERHQDPYPLHWPVPDRADYGDPRDQLRLSGN